MCVSKSDITEVCSFVADKFTSETLLESGETKILQLYFTDRYYSCFDNTKTYQLCVCNWLYVCN